MSERNIMTAGDLAIAYAELQLADKIQYGEDGERFYFTDAGLNAAFELWHGLPPKDRLSLFLLTKLIIETGADFDKGEGNEEGDG